MTRTGLSPLAWLAGVEERRRAQGLRRTLRARPPVGTELDLASNDYLGLSQHPDVLAGGVQALRTWGAGAGGSRLVTGNTELHEHFEAALAEVERHGPAASTRIGDVPVDEPALRDALESAYRESATLAATRDERIDLVDRANAVRRWTAW